MNLYGAKDGEHKSPPIQHPDDQHPKRNKEEEERKKERKKEKKEEKKEGRRSMTFKHPYTRYQGGCGGCFL